MEGLTEQSRVHPLAQTFTVANEKWNPFQIFGRSLQHSSFGVLQHTRRAMASEQIFAYVDYEDDYVQPLILAAIKTQLPPELIVFIHNISALPTPSSRLLQWRQYEKIDLDHLTQYPNSSVANSYIIRKALIRKHYLATTISNWLTKTPSSILKDHVKPSVEFEIDYAEFLDDSLVEAFELHESWARNEGKEPAEREWWILKPGMSERGQGIRLFSTEEELTEIFEAWDPASDDEETESSLGESDKQAQDDHDTRQDDHGVITAQLRHFTAQSYIHNPLLLPEPHPSASRKFHVRTYVLAVGALKVYVHKPMLALFAGKSYARPGPCPPNEDLASHLTNTCLQDGRRDGSVHTFWSLPAALPNLHDDWRQNVFKQICAITAETFEAAARSMSVHFQVLPNVFEIFGLDFLVDESGGAWLLEVNAFPDFQQTGDDLKELVKSLIEGVVRKGVGEFFGVEAGSPKQSDGEKVDDEPMVQVLDLDLGRR